MRAKRRLSVRLASVTGAVALGAAGLAGSVGLVASGTVAGADSAPFSTSCNLGSFGTNAITGLVITGKISPNPPGAGKPFTLNNFALLLHLGSNATLLANSHATISGTFTTAVTATGATPASQNVTFTIPSTVVQASDPPITSPGSATTFTTASSGSTPVVVSTAATGTLNLVVSILPTPVTGACTSTPTQIDALQAGAAVTSVLANSGPTAGGTKVTIHGTHLENPTGVTFGSTPALGFSARTPNSITAVAPPGAGTVDVQVTTSAGVSLANAGDHFTYTNGPIVNGISPNTSAPGSNTLVMITGQQFTGATTLSFGSTPAVAFTIASATSIVAIAPPGTGVVDVTVAGPLGTSVTSAQDLFNYRAGYWLTASDGGVFTYGSSPFAGSAGALTLNKPIVGMASTPDGGGYWLVASDGGVFTYGNASFYGSAGALALNKPIVGMAATPDGFGYWLVASDGGVFSYGDAVFFGSTGNIALNKPIVTMASTPDGGGYWLVASDGGVFAFGDAVFFGSLGGTSLKTSVVAIAPTADGAGYWLATADGGVFAFGDATSHGSLSGIPLNKPIVGMAGTPGGSGYWLVASDGGVFAFGDATFSGSAGGIHLNKPIVGMAAVS
jgi:hypothetical protein